MGLTRFWILAGILAGILQGCGESEPVFHDASSPSRLSDWNLLSFTDNKLVLNGKSLHIQPVNTLFTDYAHKLRTLWIPENSKIELVNNRFSYPVGTILSKTFYYPIDDDGKFLKTVDSAGLASIPLNQYHLVETRLLVRRESEWVAFPYVWNEDQSEAFLRVAGANIPASIESDTGHLDFTYFVPNENQCSGCHTRIHPDGGLEPLGAIASQLNHSIESPEGVAENILTAMKQKGWLESIPDLEFMPGWQDESLPLEDRAVAYLDMNCGHCHNPSGPADTSALLLDGLSRSNQEMGLCKPPVAAGRGAGDKQFGIVPGNPDESILVYRMQSTEPDEMMPELGRLLVHAEGVDLISDWISQLSGVCN